jgi:hypothetical protein
VHSGMHVFSIVVLLQIRMAFVYAAAFNPLWCPHARNLSQALSVLVTQTNISQAWSPSRQVGLEVKQPYWSSPSAFGLQEKRQTSSHVSKRSSTPAEGLDTRPTPPPTGDPSPTTTVHITDESDFSLIVPGDPQGIFVWFLQSCNLLDFLSRQELISEAEEDGVSFCTAGSSSSGCSRRFNDGFVTAAAIRRSDDGAYIQVGFPCSSSSYRIIVNRLSDHWLFRSVQIPNVDHRRWRSI